ncbi:MAG: glycosyltransferase family 9 protein [Verrucomicrobiae bacterium]|nr:glycosyltransferase family 9 protein [Verrucomicrobiae bacterium]
MFFPVLHPFPSVFSLQPSTLEKHRPGLNGKLLNRLVFHLFQSVFHRLSEKYPPTPSDLRGRPLKKILVFSAAGIGDTLTDSVAIRALKESFPQAQITVVTHRRRAALVRHNPFTNRVILYHKSIFRFFSLALSLRRDGYDAIVMLRGNDPDLWPLAYLVNRHAVVSCPIMTRFGFLISHPVSIPAWDQTHGVEQTLEIVRSLGAQTKDPRLVYTVQQEERESIRRQLGSDPRPLVVFQTGGGRRSAWRDWPAEHYASLGRLLLENYDVRLALLGGRDLTAKAASIQSALPAEVLNLTGKLTLAESAALLAESKILVSTDTGIMHLGFAVGVDTLALIHCNNPASRVGPWGYGQQHPVVQLQPPPGAAADTRVSMSLITPSQVWQTLDSLCQRHGFCCLQKRKN